MAAAAAGYFGKLPARGDFLRRGLPSSFLVPWEIWLQEGLRSAAARWPEDWKRRLLNAPVCHFHLASGLCGSDPVAGLLVPSQDRVGRAFPLTLAWVGPLGGDLAAIDTMFAGVHAPLAAAFAAGGRPEALDELLVSARHLPVGPDSGGDALGGAPTPGWYSRIEAAKLPQEGRGRSHWWTTQRLLVALGLPPPELAAEVLCQELSDGALAAPAARSEGGGGEGCPQR